MAFGMPNHRYSSDAFITEISKIDYIADKRKCAVLLIEKNKKQGFVGRVRNGLRRALTCLVFTSKDFTITSTCVVHSKGSPNEKLTMVQKKWKRFYF